MPRIKFGRAVEVPGTAESFDVGKKFVRHALDQVGVSFNHLGDNWWRLFQCKVEAPMQPRMLFHRKAQGRFTGGSIITALGGKALMEVRFSEIFNLALRQPDGGKGVLLNNGWANIFCVSDASGVFWVLGMRWHVNGWYIDYGPISSDPYYGARHRIFHPAIEPPRTE